MSFNHRPLLLEAPVREVPLEVLPAIVVQPVRLQHAETLSNLWRVFLGQKNIQPRTLLNWEHTARKFCAFFQNAHMNDADHTLTPQGMIDWMTHLRAHRSAYKDPRPLSAARINKLNSMVKAFLGWLKKMRYIHEDLADCIPILIAEAPKEPKIITEEDYEKIKAYCAGRDRVQVHLWLCILGYRTGMGLIDCCHLRWCDVHLNDDGPSYIDIRRIKLQRMGNKAKCQIPIVPMSDIHLWLLNLKKVVPWQRADGVTDYVHQETQGLYVTPFVGLRHDFKRIFRAAGVDSEKTFKCFRNSLCSNLVNSGMQLALVCKITGHNSVKTLLGYLKPDRRALQDGMAHAQQYSSLQAGVGKGSDGMVEGA